MEEEDGDQCIDGYENEHLGGIFFSVVFLSTTQSSSKGMNPPFIQGFQKQACGKVANSVLPRAEE